MAGPTTSLSARLCAASAACGAALIALGVVGYLGRLGSLSKQLGFATDFTTMKVNTALGFLLAGLSLRSAQAPETRLRGYAAAGIVTLLGLGTLLEYWLGWETGLDQLLLVDRSADLYPGRMSPITAVLFVVLGSALLLIDQSLWRSTARPSELLALAVSLTVVFVLVGYLYEVQNLYRIAPFSSVPLETASAFGVAAAGVLLARPDLGAVMRRLTSEGPAGTLIRQLVPAALFTPLLLGWLRLFGERQSWYSTEVGLALFVLSNVVCFGLLIWLTAGVLERADHNQARAAREQTRHDELRRMAFGAARMMAWEADLTTGALRVSDNAHELLGLLPTNKFDRLEVGLGIIHEGDRDSIARALEHAAKEGETDDRRFRIVRQDTGKTAWLEWRSVARIGPAGGSVVGGVLLDIDDAVRREEALRVSEARYRVQFESAPEAILTYDVDRGACVEVNENAERLFGYDRHVLANMSRVALQPTRQPDGRVSAEAGPEYVLRALAGEVLVFEWTYLHAHGQTIPCEVRLVRQPGEGRLVRASIVDISERKRTEAARTALEDTLHTTEVQLRQAQKMEAIGRLAGGVAHDFNNLLFVILGYGSLVLDGLRENDPLRAHQQQIMQASERAARLTAQLLAFSRQQVLSARVMNLNDTIHELADMLRRLIGEDVHLSLSLQAQQTVCVDPSQLEQVVMNLVVNARDAMPAGGELSIETRDVELDEAHARQELDLAPGPYVQLCVSDTGCGMDAALCERIFEPFFTTKSQGKGTGLGLSTVFGIVKQSGGGLSVQSEVGKGTIFELYLPRGDARAEVVESNGKPAPSPRGSACVLLVEDDDGVRGLARVILAGHGYRVLEAITPGDALLICEQFVEPIDLMLTDVVMPRMSGRELAERLAPLRPEMKVLFMSGYTDDAIVHHGVQSAMMAFVQKPLMPDELLAKIRQVLQASPG